jgi:hypothetical protein
VNSLLILIISRRYSSLYSSFWGSKGVDDHQQFTLIPEEERQYFENLGSLKLDCVLDCGTMVF